MQAKVKAIHNWETTITSESKLAISSCPGRMFANSRHAWLVAELPDPLAFGTWLGPTMHKCQRSHRTGYYEFYINLFNLEVMLGYVLFSFKLEVNVFNLDIILHYFRLDAGRTDILIKQSNIVRINILETSKNKTLKQGWMLKSQSCCNFFTWNFKPTWCRSQRSFVSVTLCCATSHPDGRWRRPNKDRDQVGQDWDQEAWGGADC